MAAEVVIGVAEAVQGVGLARDEAGPEVAVDGERLLAARERLLEITELGVAPPTELRECAWPY